MKGLIIKDITSVIRQIILFIICTIVILFIGYYIDEDLNFVAVITTYLCIICSSFTSVSILSDDEKCGFDKYVRVLPISKKNVIIEKYILALTINIIYIIIYYYNIIIASRHYLEYAKTVEGYMYAAITLTLLLTAIVMFLTIKFNVQKASLISVTVLPIIVFMVINILCLYDNQYNNLEKLLWNTRFIFPVVAIIAYVLSFYMSYRIYLKKECN